jgi:hypothetical protein
MALCRRSNNSSVWATLERSSTLQRSLYGRCFLRARPRDWLLLSLGRVMVTAYPTIRLALGEDFATIEQQSTFSSSNGPLLRHIWR